MAAVYRMSADRETRRWFFDPEPISWAAHVNWYLQVLVDPNRVLYIGEDEGVAGTVRFDRDGDQVEVSITVEPERRGQGLGRRLLEASCAAYGPATFVAHVQARNEASMQLFSKWKCEESEGGVSRFSMRLSQQGTE